MKERNVLVIHGPNLNLLGKREPEIYGSMSLTEIDQKITEFAGAKKIRIKTVQSNSEGTIIDNIHDAMGRSVGIIINPGAYTHYSYAIADAVKACGLPVIEIHLTNIYAREEFRRRSVIAPYCKGQISGLGWKGYIYALEQLISGCKE